MAEQPSPREVLELMTRTDRGDMTVWSPIQVRDALDAYQDQVLTEAAERLTVYADIGFPCVSLDGQVELSPAQLRFAASLIADRTTTAQEQA